MQALLQVGPERPYLVFIVRGVEHSHSAPTVIPYVKPLLDGLDVFDLADFAPTTSVVASETAKQSPQAAPTTSVVGTAPAKPRDPRGPVEFAYDVFDALGAVWTGWLPLDFEPAPAPSSQLREGIRCPDRRTSRSTKRFSRPSALGRMSARAAAR
jgi:hypothetical protein